MMVPRHSTHLVMMAATVALGAACAPIQPAATVTGGSGPGIAAVQAVPDHGPQARVAVAKFVDKRATVKSVPA